MASREKNILSVDLYQKKFGHRGYIIVFVFMCKNQDLETL